MVTIEKSNYYAINSINCTLQQQKIILCAFYDSTCNPPIDFFQDIFPFYSVFQHTQEIQSNFLHKDEHFCSKGACKTFANYNLAENKILNCKIFIISDVLQVCIPSGSGRSVFWFFITSSLHGCTPICNLNLCCLFL